MVLSLKKSTGTPLPLPSGCKLASAETGIAVPSIMMFASVFHIGGDADCYAGGLSKLCHKHVNDVCTSLMLHLQFTGFY
jgi:hypothetical protein